MKLNLARSRRVCTGAGVRLFHARRLNEAAEGGKGCVL